MNGRALQRVAAACAATVALTLAASAQQKVGDPQDIAAVEAVMDSYHQAVLTHDGAGITKLFLKDGSTWINVLDDATLAAARQKTPAASKVRVSTYQKFADFVTNTKDDLDPQHSDLSLYTNGTIATVYFKFKFFTNKKLGNSGAESWQLVKTEDGWRIASLIYSSSPAGPGLPRQHLR